MLRSVFTALAMSISLFSNMASAQAAKALVPAYIYPSDSTTWQPLYSQIDAHPEVTFIVIVNPASGPGNTALPDTNYQREILALHQRRNTKVVGYVPLTYARRPAANVTADIDMYARWPRGNPAVYVEGIFFDETPVAANAGNISYVQDAVRHTRSQISAAFVVTNPGVPPESKDYLNAAPAPDLALVFENTYQAWSSAVAANRQKIWDLDADDDQLAVMLHDMPSSLSCADLTALANDLKGNVGVGSLWFTDRVGNESYTGWPSSPHFGQYVNTYANGGKAC